MEFGMSSRMRLAVPSNGQGGTEAERSGHFGHCDCFTLVDLEGGEVVSVEIIDNPPHVDGGCLQPVNLLAGHGVTALVVAGMGARPLAGLNDVGIEVFFENATPGVGDVVGLVAQGQVARMDARNTCQGH
jgi:predicted Fe-Mo cluster-binding NifX family protein